MYKAFISYNRADIKFARSLQRRLETYVLPKAVELTEVQARSKKPLHPIFRDEDEMVAGGALTERLREAITKSEYLIVVCSPAAATAGAWVDVEIREFLTRHGPDRLLAVVIAGEPDAVKSGHAPGEECMPPSLLQLFDKPATQPLWVDMRPEKRDRAAFLRIVAGLLGIDSLDQLVQRDAQRATRRRQNIGLATAAAALILALLGTALYYQRSVAQAEAGNVALSRARNALLAGRAREGYTILREAYASGIRGDVANALVNMASWLPQASEIRAAPDNPLLLRRRDALSILHASGRETRIAANLERLLFTHGFSRAVVYGRGRLETFSLTDGRRLSSRDLGLALRPEAPVVAAPSGSLALGFVSDGTALHSTQSFLVVVNDAGIISEPVATHLAELDGERDTVNTIHLSSVPLIQGDCRYFGFLRPEVAAARWAPGSDIQASMADFVFFELAAGGMRRIQEGPSASQYSGVIPAGVLPYEPSIRPDGPNGPATGTNLDQLNTYCDGKLSRDLAGQAVAQSFVEIGANADREPQGWWTIDPRVAPEQLSPAETPEQNPCARRRCRLITSRPTNADGSPSEIGWDYFSWVRAPLPRGAARRSETFLFGSQVSGQVGHEYAICHIPAAGTVNCGSFAGTDMSGTGFSGAAISPDGSIIFAAGTSVQGHPGFALLRLAQGREIGAWRQGGPAFAGELADFSADGSSLVTLDEGGTLTSWAIGESDLKPISTATTGFVPAFDVYEDSLADPNRSEPVPVGLRWVDDDHVLIVRRDGGIALIATRTGQEVWQSRFRGIGVVEGLTLSSHRGLAMISGRAGARIIDIATGIPASGVFGYPDGTIGKAGVPDIWVAEDGKARLANISRRARPRPAIAEAIHRLDAYFRG